MSGRLGNQPPFSLIAYLETWEIIQFVTRKAILPSGIIPEKSASGEIGTVSATIANDKSCTATRPSRPRNGWGGARNSGSRTSDNISLSMAEGVLRAARNAAALGLPLNRHLTIHWDVARLPGDREAEAITSFLTLARDWVRKRGGNFAWVYVRENPGGACGHVHILMHLHPDLAQAFAGRQRGWIKRVTGERYRSGTLLTKRIGGTLRAAWTTPAKYEINLGIVIEYILKGAAPAVGLALGIDFEDEGRVIGKRVGWSENLGERAMLRRRIGGVG